MTAAELDAAIDAYRLLHEAVPIPTRLPTEEEVAAMEGQMALRFHPDLRRFLMRASDVNYGTRACVVLTKPDSHRFLPRVCENAWGAWGVPRDLVPVCADNANFYCVAPDGQVVYWGHDDGEATETWPSLAAWIRQVLIEEQRDC